MKILRDDIARFFDYGIEISSRTVYVGSHKIEDGDESGTDAMMAGQVIRALHILDSQAPGGDKPINMIMNNPGGDFYHGRAIYDAISLCKNHVTIKGFGYVMSMGSVIFQAADERLLAPNATMMLHYGEIHTKDHAINAERWTEESHRLRLQMEQVFLWRIKEKEKAQGKKRGLFTLEKLRKKMQFDWYLTAEECVEIGLADGIIQPPMQR